jgi:hypothetical protein
VHSFIYDLVVAYHGISKKFLDENLIFPGHWKQWAKSLTVQANPGRLATPTISAVTPTIVL